MLVIGYAIPGFLVAVFLLVMFAGGSFFQWFPSRGLTSDNWNQLSLLGKVVDYFWHLTLPLIAMSLGAFTTMTFLTTNSFLDEIRKQYVLTARAKGLGERQVLYGHVFRNAMLLIIAGFPGAFIHAFFSGSLLIETIFSLDGLGLLSFESVINRDYPVVFATLYIFALVGLAREPASPTSSTRWSIRASISRRGRSEPLDTRLDDKPVDKPVDPASRRRRCRRSRSAAAPAAALSRGFSLSPLNRRRWRNFKANRRGYWSLWIFLGLFVFSLFAEFIANDKPIVAVYKGELLFPVLVDYPEAKFGGFLAVTDYKDPVILDEIEQERLGALAADPLLLPLHQQGLPAPQERERAVPGLSRAAALVDARASCARRRADQLARYQAIGNRNWLGTDDQGRDVLARLIYGFRISVLFGLLLTDLLRHHRRRRPAPCRATSAAGSISSSSASWRSGRRSRRCSC